jgi:hypothetical protein
LLERSNGAIIVVPKEKEIMKMTTLTRNERMLAGYRCYGARPEARPCDATEIIRQIGGMTLLGVSGGRWFRIYNGQNSKADEVGVFLPCGRSRGVEVVLNFLDVYEVRRVRMVTRGANLGDIIVEAEATNVYCDEVSEVVYRMSCWK